MWNGFTSSHGLYNATGVADGIYRVTAYPPAGSTYQPVSDYVVILGGEHVGADLQFEGPKPIPAGTTISPSSTGGDGVPVVYWHDPLVLRTHGCAGGTATYAITSLPDVYALGSLTEGPRRHLHGHRSPALARPRLRDGRDHDPLPVRPRRARALQHLHRSERRRRDDDRAAAAGLDGHAVALGRPERAVQEVPDGSAIMAPTNRANPDTTDSAGHFGWDVITGYYRVRASHAGLPRTRRRVAGLRRERGPADPAAGVRHSPGARVCGCDAARDDRVRFACGQRRGLDDERHDRDAARHR